jgi:hypothetical protein
MDFRHSTPNPVWFHCFCFYNHSLFRNHHRFHIPHYDFLAYLQFHLVSFGGNHNLYHCSIP